MTTTALPTTTTCVICGRDDIPTEGKFIHYCIIRQDRKVISREYCGWFDGRPINYGADYHDVEVELDHYVTDLMRDTAVVSADMAADAAELPNGWMRMPEGDILDTDGMRVHLCPGIGLADCGKPMERREGYCPRCAEILDRVFADAVADPPAGPDSDPVPPWPERTPNLFEQYRAAYGWACVALEDRQAVEIAA